MSFVALFSGFYEVLCIMKRDCEFRCIIYRIILCNMKRVASFCGLFYGIAQPLESTADLESLWRRAQGGERTNKVKVLNWTETQVT